MQSLRAVHEIEFVVWVCTAGRGVHGIVLEAFGAGNMPVNVVQQLKCTRPT
jgi:L-asparaginase/Glu-tRNA(Gln) amidotransferase subunit D